MIADIFPISRSLRQDIVGAYPALARNRHYNRLFRTVAFPRRLDQHTGNPLLTRWQLAEIEEKDEQQVRWGNYSGQAFIDRYQRDTGHLFRTSAPRYMTKEARTVVDVGLDATLQRAINQELASVPVDPVDFFTGSKLRREHFARQRRQDAAQAQTYRSKYPETQGVINYLNALPPHQAGNAFRKHGEQAIDRANQMRVEGRRTQDLVFLRYMLTQPKQFYRASKANRSRRLFPAHIGYGMLSKEIAGILGQDWYEFDLRSSQLASFATLAHVEPVTAFLQTGGSIWEEFYAYLGVDQHIKPALKDGSYALVYGASEQTICDEIEGHACFNEEPIDDLGTQLLAHPLMIAMRVGRDEQLAKIWANRGAYDCYGSWIPMPIDPVQSKQRNKARRKAPNPRSVLATLAQAMEFHLLAPVFELAQRTQDFSIPHFAHDGFCLHFTDHRRAQSTIRRLTEAVHQQAEQLGVYTVLELTREPV